MSLRDRCKAFFQDQRRKAIMREGDPVQDIHDFVLSEVGRDVIRLTPEEFEEFERNMANPAPPTPSILVGAALIQKLHAEAKAHTTEQAVREDERASQAIKDVLAERRRQVEREGWTSRHDDEHDSAEMADAAACYALSASNRGDFMRFWPWDDEWWKPATPRRDLVKAGALILAEIERLDRLSL